MKKHTLFECVNTCLVLIVALMYALPFANTAAKAFSSDVSVALGQVMLLPKGFQLDTMRHVLRNPEFGRALRISVIVTSAGTFFAMLLTVTTAYSLSKKNLKGRKAILGIFIAAMLFNGGMIPNYVLFLMLGLTNTVYALVFSGMFSVFNMLLVKNYFESLPKSVEEAARIDGANDIAILFRIVIPMSAPVLIVTALFYAVSYWGNYFSGVLYITDPNLRTIPHYLYDLITESSAVNSDVSGSPHISMENIKAAAILISALPVLAAYPFFRRCFDKGITFGSVKE